MVLFIIPSFLARAGDMHNRYSALSNANMLAASDKVENKRESFGRKNTPEERARMQNERRKRKRKARSAKKEGNGKKGCVST